MPSCNTYHLAWLSLTLDVGYVSTAVPESKATVPCLDEGYLLTAVPTELEGGVAPLGPPAPCSHHSLDVGLLFSAASLDLGRGVAPLGHQCVITHLSQTSWNVKSSGP